MNQNDDTDIKIKEIKKYLKKINCYYLEINSHIEVTKIHNLYINKIFTEPSTVIEYTYYGLWYNKHRDYENMKKYYLKAIDLGNSKAMSTLACWYKEQGDYENMKKYYLMAIDLGNSKAMSTLAYWYGKQGDYKNEFKYTNMYVKKTDDYISYVTIFNKLKNKDLDEEIIKIICETDISKIQDPPASLALIIELYKSKIDLLKLHFEYVPGAAGEMKAKQHYIDTLTKSFKK